LHTELAIPFSDFKRKYHASMEDMGAWLLPMRVISGAQLAAFLEWIQPSEALGRAQPDIF
jgi:hypothetical protein